MHPRIHFWNRMALVSGVIIAIALGFTGCSTINNQLGANLSDISTLKPQDLQTATGANVVLLRWKPLDHGAVAGYRILRSLSETGPFQTLISLDNVPQYADRSVTNGITYYYRIAALDNRQNLSQLSDIVSATPSADSTAPAAPASLSLSNRHLAIQLDWPLNTEPDLAGYVLFRASGSTAFEQVATLSPVTQHIDTDLVAGTRYRYRLGAIDLSGNISPYIDSDPIIAIADTTPPAKPEFIPPVIGNQSIQLNWQSPTDSDVAQYRLFRRTATSTWALVAQLGPVYTFQDNGLTNGTEYRYQLVAIDQAGNTSVTSDVLSVTPIIDSTAPASPQGLTAVGRPTSALLGWQSGPESDLSRYAIYRQNPGSQQIQFIGAVNPPTRRLSEVFQNTAVSSPLTFLDLGLQTGATYTYFVSAFDRSGNESIRARVQVTTQDDQSGPTAPTPQSVYPVGSGTTASPYLTDIGTLTVVWAASPEPDINRYEIYMGTSPDFLLSADTKVGSVGADTLRFTISGLNNGTIYYIRIVAIDDLSNRSVESTPVAFQPRADGGQPETPQNVRFSVAQSQIILNWTSPTDPNIVAARVYFRTSLNQSWQLLVQLPPTQNRYVYSDAIASIIYRYSIRFVSRTGIESEAITQVSASPIADRTAPAPPAQIGGTPLSQKIGIYIKESPSIDVQYYLLYRRSSPNGSDTLVHTWNSGERQANGFYYYEDAVTPETPYYYSAVAVDYADLSARSAQISLSALPDLDPPPKVLGIGLTGSNRSARLTWQAINGVADLAGYTIYRGTQANALSELKSVGKVSEFTDSDLSNGTPYYYAIRSRDSAGNLSPLSDISSVTPTTNLLPPSAVSGIELDGQIRLNWNASLSSDITGYALYRGLASGGPYSKVTDLGLILSYADTSVQNDTLYYYVLRSVKDSQDESGNSNEVGLTAHPDRTPPPIPNGVSTQVGNRSQAVLISWTSVNANDLAGYVVEAATQPGGPYTVLNNQIGTTPQFLATGLPNGQPVYFVVKSRDLNGNISNASAEISAIPNIDTQGPDTPSNGTAGIGHTLVKLTWDRILNVFNDFKEYVISRSTVSDGPYTEIAQVSAIDTLTYSDATVGNGTPYYYRLAARDTANNLSAPSTPISATPRQLAAPNNVRTVAGHKKITVLWDDLVDGNLYGYGVYIATTVSGPFTLSQTTGAGVHSATITNLVNANTYYFYVKSIDKLQQSSPESAHVLGTPVLDNTPPRAPSSLTGIASGSDILLNWTAPNDSDLIGFQILRRTLGASSSELVSSVNIVNGTNQYTYLDSSSIPNTAYYYVIKAVDEAGNLSASSNEIQISPENAALSRISIQTRGGKITVGNIFCSWYALTDYEKTTSPQPGYDSTKYTAQSSTSSQKFSAEQVSTVRKWVRVTLSAPTTGWIGLAYKKPDGDSSLKNCTIIVGYVTGGSTGRVQDQFGTSASSRNSDTALGGSDNVELYEASESNGRTTITFFIPLTKSDNYDAYFLDDGYTEFPSTARTVFLMSGPSDSFTGNPSQTIPLQNFSF